MTSEARSEPQAVAGGPGARLRAAREAAGLTLDQAAQQLKLAPRQVKALEEEDFSHLPGKTFTRGFVRNYARLVNLDAQGLLALMPDESHAPALGPPPLHSTGATIVELPAANGRGPGLARWAIPALLVGCVVAAASYEWYRGRTATQSGASGPTMPVAATAVESASPSVSSTPLPNPVAEAAPTAPVEPAAAEAPAAPTQESAAAASTEPATAPQGGPAGGESPPAVSAAPLQLSYQGPSWTEIRDRDGQVLLSRLVPAGSQQAVQGAAPFDIVIGNASAVTLVYRGKPVDLMRYTRQNVARLQLH
jgi:cytoskeleton protein RodZ